MKIRNVYQPAEMKRFEKPNYSGSVAEVGKAFGAEKLGFHVEIMDPGQFSAPYHSHLDEEEMFLVLEGEAIVRCADQFRKVGPGDLIFYRTGQATPHNMYNHTDKPFKFLAISNSSDTDVCHYPDSCKVTTSEGIAQDGKIVDYWKDEEDPAKYWPAHALKGEV